MSLLPLGFLLLVVLLGGITAYYADLLGRKLGKKRLTLLKLRPRHTAALITTGAGMAIPLLTIAILSAASADFRKWVLEAPRAIIERDQLRTDLRDLRLQETTLRQTTKDLERQKKEAEHVLETTKAQLAEAGKNLKKLEAQIRLLQARVRTSSALIVKLNRRIEQVQNEFRVNMLALKQERTRLERTKTEFSEAYKQRNEAYAELTKTLNENASLEKELVNLNVTIGTLGKQRDTLQDDIRTAREAFDKVLTANQEELRKVQFQLELSKQDLDDITTRLDTSQKMLATSVEVTRTRAMTFRLGEEVSRLAVPAGLSRNDAVGFVNNLVKGSQSQAIARKAKARGQFYPVAGLFPRSDPKTGRTITTEEIISAIAQRLAGSTTPLAIIAYSSLNAFEEEPVSLEVAILENPIVYFEGDLISEVRVDGSKDDATVYRQIAEFVSSKVKERLEADRMIPRAGAANTFGDITADEILNLVHSVKETGRAVRIQALAAKQTRAADAIQLVFRLR